MVKRRKKSNQVKNQSKKYKVTNWREYNEALKQRGSLSIWISEDIQKNWYVDNNTIVENGRGRRFIYFDWTINLILTLRSLYKLPLCQVTGFCESLLKFGVFDLTVPNFSRLSRRGTVALNKELASTTNNTKYLIIDSTGIKLFGESEWLQNKYGSKYQRKVWRKMSICIDDEGFIISRVMTNHLTHDQESVEGLLTQANIDNNDGEDNKNGKEITVIADMGYSSKKIFNLLDKSGIKPIIPVPKNSIEDASVSASRNQTVRYIRDKGIHAWAMNNDYGRREKVENTFYRYKTIIGSKLRSRKWENQDSETHRGCQILNKMTKLGMPKSIKVA